MDLKSLITQYLRLKSGYPLQKDESIIKLQINDTVVAFEEALEGNAFFMFAVIDTVPHERELEIMREALSGNLFHKETGDASIGYDKETRTLVLFQKIPLEHMDEHKLESALTIFLAHLSYLKTKFEPHVLK